MRIEKEAGRLHRPRNFCVGATWLVAVLVAAPVIGGQEGAKRASRRMNFPE